MLKGTLCPFTSASIALWFFKQSHLISRLQVKSKKLGKDHNTVWERQGGTVGKATEILSSAEEQSLIENEFKGD